MGRIDRLAERYKSYIALPWRKDLAGAQRTIFIVYDKADERRLRARKDLFVLATKDAGHGWLECDLTRAFSEWMADTEYRDSYFESPEDLELKLEDDFLEHVAGRVREALMSEGADDEAVVGIFGIASLFGYVRVSELMKKIERDIRGRLAVFFPGEYDDNKLSVAGCTGWLELPRGPDHHAGRLRVYEA